MPATTRAKCKEIRNRRYPESQWPGVIHTQAILAQGGPGRSFLEIGCGRDAKLLRHVAPNYRFSWGLDLQVAVQGAPEERWATIRGDAHHVPLEDASVDVIAMKDVVEHLAAPVLVFRECARVLRPGGRLLVTTVNQWFPPIVLGRILPQRLRKWVNRTASGTADEDTFPAFYRANSSRALGRATQQAGFRPLEVRYLSCHPQYLMFSLTAYRLGTVMERLVRRHEWLRHWRHFLHASFVLPADEESGAEHAGDLSHEPQAAMDPARAGRT